MGQLASMPGLLRPGHPFYPFHPSEPSGGIVVEAAGLGLWYLWEWELRVHERIRLHPTFSLLQG